MGVSATAWQRASGIRRRRWRLWLACPIMTSFLYVPYVACVALDGNPALYGRDFSGQVHGESYYGGGHKNQWRARMRRPAMLAGFRLVIPLRHLARSRSQQARWRSQCFAYSGNKRSGKRSYNFKNAFFWKKLQHCIIFQKMEKYVQLNWYTC